MSIGKTPSGEKRQPTAYCKSPNCERSGDYISIRYAWAILIFFVFAVLVLMTLLFGTNMHAYRHESNSLREQNNALIQERMDSIKTNITVIITDPITGAHNDYHLQ